MALLQRSTSHCVTLSKWYLDILYKIIKKIFYISGTQPIWGKIKILLFCKFEIVSLPIVMGTIVENDKKRRLRNLKNLLKGLQQFFVIPYRSRLSRSPKTTILISSDRKKSSMNSQNKVYLHVIGMRNN